MSTRTNTGIKSKGRSRHAPSLAGMDMGDASLIAINERCQQGVIDYYAFNAGKIWAIVYLFLFITLTFNQMDL